MISGYGSAATLNQLQRKLETLSNNIANAHTVGFKGRSVSFSDVLSSEYTNQPNESRSTPHGLRVGTGAKTSLTGLSMTQGSIQETERALDFALTEPNLFFTIATSEGQRLTRDGTFYFSETGGGLSLVTKNGDPVLGADGLAITLPQSTTSVRLESTGLIAELADGTEQVMPTFGLTEIERPQALEAVGENQFLYQLNDAAFLQAGEGQVTQKALEQSNVDISQEMTQLIATQRQIQLQARAFTFSDDMAGLVNNIRR
ncbi:flagellar hook-basal body protein [Alkalihalobacillus sp. LMS6]|uniref:flagellar hook-basal body protein n=1 Tax=Alkalihalobacillus sp. LMS6 TaxID=2924034 RepID=UPI0020D11FA9|nr:flagellar hook-basal body protein [Alkalihalobacillus sp. LMS6]UTR06243.1 flagellar hook-basal body protein [Alkalihalobacillus sp. LMS6]